MKINYDQIEIIPACLDNYLTIQNMANSMFTIFLKLVALFQRKGIGKEVAIQIWNMHPGQWEILAIPENKDALLFWRSTILAFTNGIYKEEIKRIYYDSDRPFRCIFEFDNSLAQ